MDGLIRVWHGGTPVTFHPWTPPGSTGVTPYPKQETQTLEQVHTFFTPLAEVPELNETGNPKKDANGNPVLRPNTDPPRNYLKVGLYREAVNYTVDGVSHEFVLHHDEIYRCVRVPRSTARRVLLRACEAVSSGLRRRFLVGDRLIHD